MLLELLRCTQERISMVNIYYDAATGHMNVDLMQ